MKQSTTQRVKTLLLEGKKFTVQKLDKLLSTNNSAEVIRRVRKLIPVKTEWKRNRKTGKRYGEYRHDL